MKHPLLSIIIPVFDVVDYLDRCVQSILTQSFSDFELMLIDDGSTDGSSSLCDEWAKKDSRVMVVHKKNGGVSSARNEGLSRVEGDYLSFVDPDDYLAPDTYAPAMNYLSSHPEVDMIQYPYCEFIENVGLSGKVSKPSSCLLRGSRQIFENWWSGSPLEYVIWNKIYKRSLWRDVRFRVGHISEDTCLVPQFIPKMNVVYISDEGLYYYQRNRLDSYTYGDYTYDKHLDLFYAHAAIYDCFNWYPDMVTEKVLAFTRLYRRLITAKQTQPFADISAPLLFVKQGFPSWQEIWTSKGTEKVWLSIAKMLGTRLFAKLFVTYLNW